MGVGDQRHALAAVPPRKDLVLIFPLHSVILCVWYAVPSARIIGPLFYSITIIPHL